MSSAAPAAFSAFKHNGLKQACQGSKHAASHSPPANALRQSRAAEQPPSAAPEARPFLTYMFERRPRPINVTTLTPTKLHAADTSHPFYTRVNRRLRAFDPDRLYWRVHVPVDVSRKPAVRRWAMRRVREAFGRELKARGFARDGASLEGGHRSLKGALLVVLPRDSARALEVGHGEIESNAKWLVAKVVDAQVETDCPPGRGERPRLRGEPHGQGSTRLK